MKKLKEITRGQAILIGLFIIIIISGFIGIKVIKSNNIKNYKNFEKELSAAAKNYKEINNVKVKKDEEKIIKLSTLKKQNLVTSSIKDKCDGYVVLSNEEVDLRKYKIVYRSYIKCNGYMTDAYINQ